MWGAMVGAGGSAAMGGNPVIGAGLGAFGALLGHGIAGFLGKGAKHLPRLTGSMLAGGITGGIGAAAYGGDFGEGFGYGAGFAAAGYGLSAAANKYASNVIEKKVNQHLDNLQKEVNEQMAKISNTNDNNGNQQKSTMSEQLDVIVNKVEKTVKNLEFLGLKLEVGVGAAGVHYTDDINVLGFDLGRYKVDWAGGTKVTLPASLQNANADVIFRSDNLRMFTPVAYENGAMAGGIYGPRASLITNLNRDLNYGRINYGQ